MTTRSFAYNYTHLYTYKKCIPFAVCNQRLQLNTTTTTTTTRQSTNVCVSYEHKSCECVKAERERGFGADRTFSQFQLVHKGVGIYKQARFYGLGH